MLTKETCQCIPSKSLLNGEHVLVIRGFVVPLRSKLNYSKKIAMNTHYQKTKQMLWLAIDLLKDEEGQLPMVIAFFLESMTQNGTS